MARAFDAFVAAVRRDEPIILAGHSQGALHLARLLREKVAGKPIARRIVAAYVVGWPLSVKDDVPMMGLPACRTADQPNCILSWQSFGEPPIPRWSPTPLKSPSLPAAATATVAICCALNPISGTINGAAAPSDNEGSLVPSADLLSATLGVGQVGARCEGGFLIIDGAIRRSAPMSCRAIIYHVYDYALFLGGDPRRCRAPPDGLP